MLEKETIRINHVRNFVSIEHPDFFDPGRITRNETTGLFMDLAIQDYGIVVLESVVDIIIKENTIPIGMQSGNAPVLRRTLMFINAFAGKTILRSDDCTLGSK